MPFCLKLWNGNTANTKCLFGTMEQIYFTANCHEGYVRIVKIYGESLWWCDFSNKKITGVSLPQIFKSFQIANSLLDFLISRG